MDSRKSFRLYRLSPVSNTDVKRPNMSNSTIQIGEGKRTLSQTQGIESQLSDIKSTLDSLLQVSSSGLSDSEQQANKYLKMLNAIREDETLPLLQRNRLYQETHDKYLMFRQKADNEKAGQVTKEIPLPEEKYIGERKPIEKIISKVSRSKQAEVEDTLDAMKNAGNLSWNKKGELTEPVTGKVFESTNIDDVLKYHLAPNKTKMEEPRGYDLFVRAKRESQNEKDLLTRNRRGTGIRERGHRDGRTALSTPAVGRSGLSSRRRLPDEDATETAVARLFDSDVAATVSKDSDSEEEIVERTWGNTFRKMLSPIGIVSPPEKKRRKKRPQTGTGKRYKSNRINRIKKKEIEKAVLKLMK